MKKIALFGIAITIFFSCSITKDRQPDLLKCDCSMYGHIPASDTIACSGSLCRSDTCQTYVGIWKELLLSRNHLSQTYFDSHIIPCNSALNKLGYEVTFRINYKIKIDWAEMGLGDVFTIWLSPSTAGLYPSLNIPRNALLTKAQIDSMVNFHHAFGSEINSIPTADHLKYPTRQKAMSALLQGTGIDTFCMSTIRFLKSDTSAGSPVHPYLQGSGVLNWAENKCISSQIDLITGKVTTSYGVCYILFCFAQGTKITLNHGSRSIEKIKNGDTILSVNMKTMKMENDIVQQIDSVNHRNIMEIIFSDSTRNHNTFDHPYFVKGKGWCSYAPRETAQNYNLKTKQLQIGDTCLKYQHHKLMEIRVQTITENRGDTKTYNISRLRKNKSYFANGVLVSNESE